MADSYLWHPYGSGADQYQKNGQSSDQDQQSQLFRALLQQTMQSGGGTSSPGSTIANGLGMLAMQNPNFFQGMGDEDGAFGLSMGAG